ncbi:hypothetical protein OOU_Y34scaffold00177g27 [Pyricularia oryzae Y34]|uniref:Uncharacterized protein n=2 Tax=Pyricularia oryzae TaxID=318829 RepID=A0AA97P6U1_PYRO3|nr:hypothetical protein OOU_Y34scaffold00177g27 [Pyricularia oryzae Y34]
MPRDLGPGTEFCMGSLASLATKSMGVLFAADHGTEAQQGNG